MDRDPVDPNLASWLAEHGDVEPDQVVAELEVGARRRAFVVDELIDAGFEGVQLVEMTIALTGLDSAEAHALIATRAGGRRAVPGGAKVPKRDRRLAQNQILFRRINERLAAGDGRSVPRVLELICECSDSECLNGLSIEASEYAWLRQNAEHFAVLPGHEAPAVEDVFERHPSFVVVKKRHETDVQAKAADPPGNGPVPEADGLGRGREPRRLGTSFPAPNAQPRRLYRYRLIDEAGNDLGPLASRRAEWPVGERVSRWHGEQHEVVALVETSDDAGFHGYVVVKPK